MELPGRTVYARLYELNVGRVKLVLMQTNIPENNPNDRQLTDRLYISGPRAAHFSGDLTSIGGFRKLWGTTQAFIT